MVSASTPDADLLTLWADGGLKLAERLYLIKDGRIALERAVVPGDTGADLQSYYFGVKE